MSLLMMAVSGTLWVQFSRLSVKQAELTEISSNIREIQSKLQMELKEMKKLREELSSSLYGNKEGSIEDDGDINYREKRSDTRGSSNNQISKKQSTKGKMKDHNSSLGKSSLKHTNIKHAPKGIFWCLSPSHFFSMITLL
jgi:hypothetical protein